VLPVAHLCCPVRCPPLATLRSVAACSCSSAVLRPPEALIEGESGVLRRCGLAAILPDGPPGGGGRIRAVAIHFCRSALF
jgi:hypothetical protein